MTTVSFHLVHLKGNNLDQAKSREYQGVFEVKSREETWQARGIRSQQLEH